MAPISSCVAALMREASLSINRSADKREQNEDLARHMVSRGRRPCAALWPTRCAAQLVPATSRTSAAATGEKSPLPGGGWQRAPMEHGA